MPNNFDCEAAATEQAELLDANTRLLEETAAAEREITAAERRTIRRNADRIEALAEQIRSAEAAERDRPMGRKTQPDLMPAQSGADQRAGHLRTEQPRPEGIAAPGRTFAAMFGPARDNGGWGPGEFLQTLARGHSDPRFVATSVEQTGTAGGYLVPGPLHVEPFDNSLSMEVVRPRAHVYALSSNSLTLAGRDTQNRAGGDVAGLRMVWLAENIEGDVDDPIFRQVNLVAHKATILSEASVELLGDAGAFQAELVRGFAESMRVGLDTAFLHGEGIGKPLGIMNSPALVTVDTTGEVADSISYRMVRQMLTRLLPGSYNKAVWIAHPSTLDELLTLNYQWNAGTSPDEVVGGSLVNAFTFNGDTATLMGRPLLFTECANELGDSGDLVLADLSYYAVGMRREAGIEVSNAPGWRRFAISFRYHTRVAGTPLLSAPVTPVRGSTTLSPFVCLASRA